MIEGAGGVAIAMWFAEGVSAAVGVPDDIAGRGRALSSRMAAAVRAPRAFTIFDLLVAEALWSWPRQ